MKPTIFIHTPSADSIDARVSAYSLHARSQHPTEFDIRFLSLREDPELLKHDGSSIRWHDGGQPMRWSVDMPQAFVLLRRQVAELMNFTGRALLLDPDIMAVGDVWELLSRDMQGKALICRPRPQGEGFYTGVMLMDCDRLRHWRWKSDIEEVFGHERSVGPWLSLLDEDQRLIGSLEEAWNDFDTLNEQTRLLHYTNRRTQPWLFGLRYRDDFELRSSPLQKVKNLFKQAELHQMHPHEAVFLQLLRECIDKGVLTCDELRELIWQGHLRRDALSAVERIR